MSVFKLPSRSEKSFKSEIDDSFLANMNHALRTPLNGMVGMLDLLSKTSLNDHQQKYMNVLRESNESLTLQLDNVIELAKIKEKSQIVQVQTCRLEDIIKDACQPFIPAAVKKRVPLSVHLSPNLPEFVNIDGGKLRQVLANLLNCSLKFTSRGKFSVDVSLLANVAGEDHAKLRFSVDNNKVLYSALNRTLEQYEEFDASNLREFGEVTISLLTAHHLLMVMDSTICFNATSEHEAPLYFDIPFGDVASQNISAPSEYSVLKNKRALVLQEDVLDLDAVLQSLMLWHVEYAIISEADKIEGELQRKKNQGMPYQVVILKDPISDEIMQSLKTKVDHIIELGHCKPEHFPDNATYLHLPVYPDEVLSVLSTPYLEASRDHEKTVSEEASAHVDEHASFETVKAKVLVVEDDFVSRMYAVELLEGLGCEVAEAEDGQQALAKLIYGEYDAVFMDCIMPRMDGFEATHRIREEGHTDMPIIALTANTLEQDREHCLKSGMNDYIPKPVKEKDLHAALVKHIKT